MPRAVALPATNGHLPVQADDTSSADKQEEDTEEADENGPAHHNGTTHIANCDSKYELDASDDDHDDVSRSAGGDVTVVQNGVSETAEEDVKSGTIIDSK